MKKLSKTEWVAVAISIIFVSYALFGGSILGMFGSMPQNPALAIAPQTSSVTGVVVNDIVVGSGEEVIPGKFVSAHYILSLSNGTVIQNSRDLGMPIQFVYGGGEVLPAFEEGVKGMKVGGVRTIVIPPELGYGPNANGPIPANSTLIFTVEVLSVANVQNTVKN